MREVVSIHIGQAGCGVGIDVWNAIQNEARPNRFSDTSTAGNVFGSSESPCGTFLYETDSGVFRPRTVFIDTDPLLHDSAFANSNLNSHGLTSEDVLIYRQDCRSIYHEGKNQSRSLNITEDGMSLVQRQLERCDRVGGIMLFRASGGGTGSGIGDLLAEETREESPKASIIEPLIYPSQNSWSSALEPYNAIFTLAGSHRSVSLSLLLSNEPVLGRLGQDSSFKDMNKVLASVIFGITASLRHPSTVNASIDEIVTNLVPTPTFRYATVGHVSRSITTPIREVIRSLFDYKKSLLCDVNHAQPKPLFAASIQLAGGSNFSVGEVQRAVNSLREHHPVVPWVPNSFKVGLVNIPAVQRTQSIDGLMLTNTTAIRSVIECQYRKFLELFQHRSYVHHYLESGAEMEEFYSAREFVRGLISEYDQAIDICASENRAIMVREARRPSRRPSIR